MTTPGFSAYAPIASSTAAALSADFEQINLYAASGTLAVNAADFSGGITINAARLTKARSVVTGSGADRVDLQDSVFAHKVSLGAGNDRVELSGRLSASGSVDGGAGTDTIAVTLEDYEDDALVAGPVSIVVTNTRITGRADNWSLNERITSFETLEFDDDFDASHEMTVNASRFTGDIIAYVGYISPVSFRSGSGNDVIRIEGRVGPNTVWGGAGDDRIIGGGNADTIAGGAGRDEVTGGGGADRFVFAPGDFAALATPDVIRDFRHAHGDTIVLDAIDADSRTPGRQSFDFIRTTAFTGQAGELRYYVVGGDAIVEGDTNGDGRADFAISLNGVARLVAADFELGTAPVAVPTPDTLLV